MDNTINAAGIASVHSIFNVATTIMLMPFGNQLEKLACLTIKDKTTNKISPEDKDLQMLDDRFLDSPGYAIMLCQNAVAEMAKLSKEAIHEAIGILIDYNEEQAENIYRLEDEVDKYEDRLTSYLVKVSSKNLNFDEGHTVSMLLHSLNDFERISDHAINILDSSKELYDKGLRFSEKGINEINVYSRAVEEILDITIDAFGNMDKKKALEVEPLEDVIDDLNIVIKEKHIKRLRNGECTAELGFILSDITTNYERVADHCSNLAIYILQAGMEEMDTHNFLIQHGMEDSKEFQNRYIEFKNKYYID